MSYQIGQIIFADEPIIVNEGKESIELVHIITSLK